MSVRVTFSHVELAGMENVRFTPPYALTSIHATLCAPDDLTHAVSW